ncbi:MAG: 50S ribosomal protein L25 [Nitrospiraceae bacterium]|nr:50S ribosomal protein L25 [Nitrospiraceae bacterium]
MKQVVVDTQIRTEAGKGVARKLRQAGRIPGVLYGPNTHPVSLSIDAHNFNKLLISAKGERMLFILNLEGNGDTGRRTALIKNLQLHPITSQIRHIDFYEILMDEEVEVEVPIVTVGQARGVEQDMGVLEIIQRTVRVSCLPMDIPKEIEIDVSDLGLGDAIHIADIASQEGIRLLDDPDMTLVTIVGAVAEEEEAKEPEAEEEEEEEAKEEEAPK